jgi:hypothetical protein
VLAAIRTICLGFWLEDWRNGDILLSCVDDLENLEVLASNRNE